MLFSIGLSCILLNSETLVGIFTATTPGRFQAFWSPSQAMQQQTSHTALSDLFNLTPKIKTLRLPLSIPVHATTIENIASGEILKNLSIMELSYPNVCHGLDLVRRRGTLARMTATGQGCSSAEEPAVSALDSLSLWIPRHLCNMEDVFDINTKRKILVSEGLIDHIHICPTSELPLPISRRV